MGTSMLRLVKQLKEGEHVPACYFARKLGLLVAEVHPIWGVGLGFRIWGFKI